MTALQESIGRDQAARDRRALDAARALLSVDWSVTDKIPERMKNPAGLKMPCAMVTTVDSDGWAQMIAAIVPPGPWPSDLIETQHIADAIAELPRLRRVLARLHRDLIHMDRLCALGDVRGARDALARLNAAIAMQRALLLDSDIAEAAQ